MLQFVSSRTWRLSPQARFSSTQSLQTSRTSGNNWRRIKDRKFIDWRRVKVCGGRGGDGCVSFRRESLVRKGGPDGGDGGRGGAIVFVSNSSVKSLSSVRSLYRAAAGVKGAGELRHGRNGEDIVIKVPIGTVLKVDGETVTDFALPGESYVAARGGDGGAGNAAFVTPTHQSPLDRTEGGVGEEWVIELELKTIADIGLVGFPNAGKSTLLRALSRAKPTVAAYPFTTLNPHVGMVESPNHPDTQIAVADIPGLLPGAHRNVGLGHSFLRHIERCHSLLYVLDCSHGSPQLFQQLQQLHDELQQYSPLLPHKARLIVANKVDLEGADMQVRDLSSQTELPIVPVSGLKLWNIQLLKKLLYDLYCKHVAARGGT